MSAPRDKPNAPTLYYFTPELIAGMEEMAMIETLFEIISSFRASNSDRAVWDIEKSCVYLFDGRIKLHWRDIQYLYSDESNETEYLDKSADSGAIMNCHKLGHFITNVFKERRENLELDPLSREFDARWTTKVQDYIEAGNMAASQKMIKEPRYATRDSK